MAQNREDYERDLLVPGFNKKEVEAISVEATKKAIANGDIQLPPGGTKLYKHVLTNAQYSLSLISTASTKDTLKFDNNTNIVAYLWADGGGGFDNGIFKILDIRGNKYSYCLGQNSAEVTRTVITSIYADMTDTVTEL